MSSDQSQIYPFRWFQGLSFHPVDVALDVSNNQGKTAVFSVLVGCGDSGGQQGSGEVIRGLPKARLAANFGVGGPPQGKTGTGRPRDKGGLQVGDVSCASTVRKIIMSSEFAAWRVRPGFALVRRARLEVMRRQEAPD